MNDANQIAIAVAGGIVAIITAMNIHPNHPEVNRGGCGALCNLAGAACENCPHATQKTPFLCHQNHIPQTPGMVVLPTLRYASPDKVPYPPLPPRGTLPRP